MTTPDPTFPALHGRPPTGWLNDPNGCGRVHGVWHVFYQFNPAAPVSERIHWGHMSSPDLVRWTTEPVALAPRPDGPDAYGCWTGCLVDDGGVPTLVYSGIADASIRSAVILARADQSDRSLSTFTRDEPPAIGMPSDPSLTDVRDPYVFTVDGHRFAVQGAGGPGGGRVLVYGCDDLTRWTELGTLLTSDDPVVAGAAGADTWECPNLFPVGPDWVLVVSLLHFGPAQPHDVAWVVGDLALADGRPRFTPRAAGRLDDGPSFYAPQTAVADGRAVLWGWARELGRSPDQVARAGWAGVLTFPREVEVRGDRVTVRPVAELDALRREPVDPTELPAAFEVRCAAATTSLGLELDGVPCWPTGLDVASVYVDGSLVEVFTRDGASYTTRAYPGTDSTWRLTGDRTGVTVHRLG